MKELYIIRHGETDLNQQGIVQGRGVDPSLNELGRQQAQQFYYYYKDVPFQIIYTSMLRRSYETVAPFIDKEIPWEKSPELDEISWGVFEGRPFTRVFKEQYQKLLDDWEAGKFNAKAEGGESPLDVSERQKKFIQQIRSRPEEKILICMHGRAMRLFLVNLQNQSLSAMDQYPHYNLTLYKVIFDGSVFSTTLFNNTDHLKK